MMKNSVRKFRRGEPFYGVMPRFTEPWIDRVLGSSAQGRYDYGRRRGA